MKIEALAAPSVSLEWLQYYDALQLMDLEGKAPRSALSRTRSIDYLRTQKQNTILMQRLMRQMGAVHHKQEIFLMLPRQSMEKMLDYLDKDILLFGLSFFSKNILIGFMSRLSKVEILKLFLIRFQLHKFLMLFPTAILWQLFLNQKIQVPQLLKAMMQLPENKLQQLFKQLTGKEGGHLQKPQLVKSLGWFKKEQLVDAFRKLDKKSMVTMLSYLAKQQPEILFSIPQANILGVLASFTKGNLLGLMSGLNMDILKIFDSCLSDKQLAFTLSYISNDIFSNKMISTYPDTIIDYFSMLNAQGAA